MRRKLTIVLWLLAAQVCTANPYYCARLSKMAKAAGLALPDTMEANANNDTAYAFKGKPLRIRTNDLGDISHIGYKLFNNQLMEAYGPSPVFDFMERYLLELDLPQDDKTLQQRMEVDNVVISEGNAGMLRLVDENTPFSIEAMKRRAYRVTWTVKGQPLTLGFQADCQLMQGCDVVEKEANLVRDMPRCTAVKAGDILATWKDAKASVAGDVKMLDDGRYLSNLISRKLFMRSIHGKDELLCTRKSVAASASNIMLTGLAAKAIPMTLAVDRYGYNTDTIMVTLQQFVAFCHREGCKAYMGVKSISDKELQGTLFILNEALAYNHVLSFAFPLGLLQGRDEPIAAKVYAYIPLQNVTEKYFNQNLEEYQHEIE